jgi:protein SCO1
MKSIAFRAFFFPAITLFCLYFLLAGCAEKSAQFKSIDITGADYAKNFSLPDVNGQTKTLADFKGKIPIVFFGFAQCPDVCPTTMAESFDPSFTALRGSPEQVAQLAKDFKIYYKKVDGKTPTSYTIDHTAASFVFDAEGKLRLYTRYGMGAQALADDLKILLR